MSIVIKGGTLVCGGSRAVSDIRIEHSLIAQVGPNLPTEGAEVVDAAGCLVFPGFIDAHTHMDMDTATTHTADDFDTGSRAALMGGTTTLVDFATQEKGETLPQALANWHAKADGISSCDYAFHMAITDWSPAVRKQLWEMKKAGVTSFKLYMAYDNLRVGDAEIYQILREVKELGGIVGVHCENGDVIREVTRELKEAGQLSPASHPLSRPDSMEAEAVARYLWIAELADAPVHIVHLSCKKSMEVVRAARARGQKVYVESCPHYLVLDDSSYRLPNFEGAKFVCSPPLRKKADMDELWQAIQQGEIQTLSTDHCSFFFKGQKEMGRDDFTQIPGGLPGVEHRPALIYTNGVCTGKITPEQMSQLLSENAAKLFGMYPQKGAILPGSDADIVIWDPAATGVIRAETQTQNVDYTPYEGMQTTGAARTVFLRGKKVVQDGKLVQKKQGSYVFRGTCGNGI